MLCVTCVWRVYNMCVLCTHMVACVCYVLHVCGVCIMCVCCVHTRKRVCVCVGLCIRMCIRMCMFAEAGGQVCTLYVLITQWALGSLLYVYDRAKSLNVPFR